MTSSAASAAAIKGKERSDSAPCSRDQCARLVASGAKLIGDPPACIDAAGAEDQQYRAVGGARLNDSPAIGAREKARRP